MRNLIPITPKPIKDQVYHRLMEAITSGELPPGKEISISHLAERLGVSMMPVREALRGLQARKLISVQSNRRIVVSRLSVKELHDLLKIRLVLECMAVSLSVMNSNNNVIRKLEMIHDTMKRTKDKDEYLSANKDFHFLLYEGSNMPILLEVIQGLWERVSPYLYLYVDITNKRGMRFHEGILEGMKEGNAKKASKWLRRDLRNGAKVLTRFLLTHET